MALLWRRGGLLFAIAIVALPLCADEIRLKDGKKLYGVIVAYDEKENLFKVKTDFGYVLVEKDKIASIIPTAPAAPKPGAKPETKTGSDTAKPAPQNQAKDEVAVAAGSQITPTTSTISARTPAPAVPSAKAATPSPSSANGKPAGSPNANPQPGSATAAAPTPSPESPKQPEAPAIREAVQGTLYVNFTYGFRMYKAPSWDLIEDARNALPNAIVAMGTSNESTLLVVGREQTKQSLDVAANTVEKRLHDVYENYQKVSQRKVTVGGSPAVEFRYGGKAADHDWSGTLVVIARGQDIFTVLGMTYADSDLIQIEENVIAKAIASINFDVH